MSQTLLPCFLALLLVVFGDIDTGFRATVQAPSSKNEGKIWFGVNTAGQHVLRKEIDANEAIGDFIGDYIMYNTLPAVFPKRYGFLTSMAKPKLVAKDIHADTVFYYRELFPTEKVIVYSKMEDHALYFQKFNSVMNAKEIAAMILVDLAIFNGDRLRLFILKAGKSWVGNQNKGNVMIYKTDHTEFEILPIDNGFWAYAWDLQEQAIAGTIIDVKKKFEEWQKKFAEAANTHETVSLFATQVLARERWLFPTRVKQTDVAEKMAEFWQHHGEDVLGHVMKYIFEAQQQVISMLYPYYEDGDKYPQHYEGAMEVIRRVAYVTGNVEAITGKGSKCVGLKKPVAKVAAAHRGYGDDEYIKQNKRLNTMLRMLKMLIRDDYN